MSRIQTTETVCPSCKEEFPFTMWEALNSSIHPEAAADLMQGKLFRLTCPHCQKEHTFAYPLLYTDMDSAVMIQLVADDQGADDFIELVSRLPDESLYFSPTSVDNYRYRIVIDPNELTEKANIFRLGLDDRVIELCKYMACAGVANSYPNVTIQRVLLSVEPPREILLFLEGGSIIKLPLPADMYSDVKNRFSYAIEAFSEGQYTIDQDWAMKVLTCRRRNHA